MEFRLVLFRSLSRILDKCFGDALEVVVTLSREAHLYRAVISAHVGRGIQIEASGEANEPYTAFDGAADRLSKRLRRYKRRLRDHSGKTSEAASQPARQYILAAEGPEESDEESNTDGQPTVVAEMTTEIPTDRKRTRLKSSH